VVGGSHREAFRGAQSWAGGSSATLLASRSVGDARSGAPRVVARERTFLAHSQQSSAECASVCLARYARTRCGPRASRCRRGGG
jgi:hypothetical protein